MIPGSSRSGATVFRGLPVSLGEPIVLTDLSHVSFGTWYVQNHPPIIAAGAHNLGNTWRDAVRPTFAPETAHLIQVEFLPVGLSHLASCAALPENASELGLDHRPLPPTEEAYLRHLLGSPAPTGMPPAGGPELARAPLTEDENIALGTARAMLGATDDTAAIREALGSLTTGQLGRMNTIFPAAPSSGAAAEGADSSRLIGRQSLRARPSSARDGQAAEEQEGDPPELPDYGHIADAISRLHARATPPRPPATPPRGGQTTGSPPPAPASPSSVYGGGRLTRDPTPRELTDIRTLRDGAAVFARTFGEMASMWQPLAKLQLRDSSRSMSLELVPAALQMILLDKYYSQRVLHLALTQAVNAMKPSPTKTRRRSGRRA